MIEPLFLELGDVLALHDGALESFGGLAGIRDEGLLLSALARAENTYAYAEPGTVDLMDLAAAYAFGIAKNHPFNDGNKRTALAASITFLRLNGASTPEHPEEAADTMVALAEGSIDEPAFAAWLRARV